MMISMHFGFFSLLPTRSISYCFVLFLLTTACNSDKNKYSELASVNIVESIFVGSISCKACHEEQFATWKNSHHDQAMKIADSVSVLADFNNTSFKNQNVKSTFFKKEGDYYVNLEGPNGEFQDYKIVYTYGVTPLQQYIIEFPNVLKCH